MKDFEFRKFVIPNPVTIRSGITGEFVDVHVVSLRFENRQKVLWCLEYIERNYNPEILKIPKDAVLGSMRLALFAQTKSRHVGAYVGPFPGEADTPFIILGVTWLKKSSKIELAATLLHELLHPCFEDYLKNPAPDSKEEALHDIGCYAALGVGVPLDHWALQKYPELFEQP